MREFEAVLDLCADSLFVKDTNKRVDIEVARTQTCVYTILSIGLTDVTDYGQEKMQQLVDGVLGHVRYNKNFVSHLRVLRRLGILPWKRCLRQG